MIATLDEIKKTPTQTAAREALDRALAAGDDGLHIRAPTGTLESQIPIEWMMLAQTVCIGTHFIKHRDQ